MGGIIIVMWAWFELYMKAIIDDFLLILSQVIGRYALL